jgi:hypothetical protein
MCRHFYQEYILVKPSLTSHLQNPFTVSMSSINQLSVSQLRKAANLKEKIAKFENELAAILGASAPAAKTATTKPAKKKGKMSAAGRARIAAAQKARWAKIKAAKKA